jgi:WD40 repeat protein
MSHDPRLSALLDRWRKSQERGEPLTPEELCRDCPELREEVQRWIAFQGMETLGQPKTPSVQGEGNEDAPPTAPPSSADDFSPTPPPKPAELERRPAVPGFEIESELGRGGWGVVYRAREVSLNRTVALKMILSGGHAGAEERQRFLAEAEVIASLQHPGIVQVYGFGTHNGLPWFALEYCAGGSLAAKLNGTPLPPREAAEIVEEVSRAVQAAHEKGVIHRDLKPGNILLSATCVPRVTDFGLARRMECGSGLTPTGAILGTPSYMAPEQARGKRVTPAADVYALGAILYECLTGRPPFKAASTHETLSQVIDDEPASLRQVNARVPKDLETICMKCLRKDPAQRYAQPLELADDLRRWQAGEPILARPVRFVERAWKWVKRRPAVAGLLLLVLVVSAGSLAAIVTLYRDAVVQRDAARGAEERAEKARELAEERVRMLQYASNLATLQGELDADNSVQALRLFDQCSSQQRGWEHGHLWLQVGQRIRAVEERLFARDRTESICFSHDGKWLAVGRRSPVISILERSTGRIVATMRGRGEVVWSVDLSSNHRWLVSAASDREIRPSGANEVFLWNTRTGQKHAELKGHQGTVLAVRFAADGSWLASAGADGKVCIQEVPSGKLLKSFQAPGAIHCLDVHPEESLLAYGSKRQVIVRDARTGRVVQRFPGHQGVINSVAFSGDGRLLASADFDAGLVYVWDVASGKRLRALGDRNGQVACVAFAPGKRPLLAFGVPEKGYTVVDLAANKTIRSIPSNGMGGESVCFSPDGSQIAIPYRGGIGIVALEGDTPSRWLRVRPESKRWQRFNVFDRMTASHLALPPKEVEVRELQRPGGQMVVRVVDRQSDLTLALFPAGLAATKKSTALLAPNGALQAEVQESAIVLRDPRSESIQNILASPEGTVTHLAFTQDGTRLAAAVKSRASGESKIKLWDPGTGVELLSWAVSAGTPRHLGFDDETNGLVLVGDRQVEMWMTPRDESITSSPRWDGLHLVQAERAARWSDASDCLDRLLLAHPDNAALRLRRARAVMAGRHFPEAITGWKPDTEHSPLAIPPLTKAIADLSHPRLRDNRIAQRLLLQAYRQQRLSREAGILEFRFLAPSLAALVAQTTAQPNTMGALGGLLSLEASRQKLPLEQGDWHGLLSPASEEVVKVSGSAAPNMIDD